MSDLPAPTIINPATPTPGRGHRRAADPSTKVLVLRVTEDEHERMHMIAELRGQTISSLMREALAVAHPGLPAMHIKVKWKTRERIVRLTDRSVIPNHPRAAIAAAARQAAGLLVFCLGEGVSDPQHLEEIRRAVADLRALASQVERVP